MACKPTHIAAEVIRKEYQRRAVTTILARVDGIGPDERDAFRFMLGQGKPLGGRQVAAGLGYPNGNPKVDGAIKKLLDAKVVAKAGGGGNGVPTLYKTAVREWVASELAPHGATDDEVEETYQAALGRIAGGGS